MGGPCEVLGDVRRVAALDHGVRVGEWAAVRDAQVTPLILDLCGGSGAWSKPYADAGYETWVVDPFTDGSDVRLFEHLDKPVHGILAAPPCTSFAGSGARWWAGKGKQALLDGLAVVDACLRVIAIQGPRWWVLENPVGRLRRYLGPPRMIFNPCDFGDPYTKKTCLWGNFTVPTRRPVAPTEGSKMHRLPPSADRWRLRSATPPGFAKAFFAANP